MQTKPDTSVETDLSPDRERRLISGVVQKDRKATAEFVSLCANTAYPFVRRRLMPRTELVEDLMQEILVAAWRNLGNFRGEGNLRSWIRGIARHKVEDYYRKKIREIDGKEDERESAEVATVLKLEEHLDSQSQDAKVQKVLADLPEAYGVALLWRYRDDRSLREMAELTGKTEKAMERLLARARESFRKRWNHD
jgi:RNA polymerase sigma-70 factor (ECF subfamily)